jgi:hypothetical protein
MRSKAEVMAYHIPPLVERLQVELKLSKKDAEQLFRDMLMFLYVCATNTSKHGFSPPPAIDEAWHNFIVFTREYAKFCKENFGYFVHHTPFTSHNREQASKGVRPATPQARKVFGKLSKNWA